MENTNGRRSLQKKPVGKKEPKKPSTAKEVTVSVTRKYSVRQYETLDISLSVTSTCERDDETGFTETQEEVTKRVFEQLKEDMVEMGNEVRKMAKANEF